MIPSTISFSLPLCPLSNCQVRHQAPVPPVCESTCYGLDSARSFAPFITRRHTLPHHHTLYEYTSQEYRSTSTSIVDSLPGGLNRGLGVTDSQAPAPVAEFALFPPECFSCRGENVICSIPDQCSACDRALVRLPAFEYLVDSSMISTATGHSG